MFHSNNKILFQFNNTLPLLTSILFILLLLTNPVNSMILVNNGLKTWYQNMIPSLFPFMVLSGFLLRTGLSYRISKLLYPVLGRLFQLSEDCIYIMFMGFLCGFPMGASITADSFQLNKITKREGDLLLAFCNNIGPVYFLSFASITCPFYSIKTTMSIMYLVPLLYGLFLRYTIFRDIPCCFFKKQHSLSHTKKYLSPYHVHKTENSAAKIYTCRPQYLKSFQEALQKGLISILMLGGYMIIFNILQLPFYNSFYQLPENALCIFKGLLEINSGITAIQSFPELYWVVYMIFLPFCGICCLFQTYSMIKYTPLSLQNYLIHKLTQTLITFCLYIMLSNIA